MKRLVSFDLDMTLLDHKTSKIPESAAKALGELKKNSYIVLATGRDMDNYFSRPYCDMVKPDAVIHTNGTKITVGSQIIYDKKMDKELMRRLFDYATEKHYAIGMTIGDDDYYFNPDVVTNHDVKRWGMCGRNYKNPWDLMDIGVRTLAYIGNEEGVRDIEAQFPEVKLPMFAGKTGADVIERCSSKGQGLHCLCDYLNIPVENTVAFGDSMNDYEIIREAGIGIAMGNAIPELKKVADYVTTDIDADGIWNACMHFQLI